jgi:hypothetical protein
MRNILKFIVVCIFLGLVGASPTSEPSGEPSGQPTGEPTAHLGITHWDWPSDGASATTAVTDATTITITDPVGAATNDAIDFKLDAGVTDVTYIGLFASTTFTSHTEGATGGPITKVACVSTDTVCVLPLYRDSNRFDPVPAGTYYALAVNGNDLDYFNSINSDWGHSPTVVINPYISAWGSTLQQTTAAPNVERGDDIQITWDGLSSGDIIVYTHDSATAGVCPADRYVITDADAAATRGTIALKTSEGYSGGIGWSEPGAHTIYVEQTGGDDFSGAANTCDLVTSRISTNRAITLIDSDTLTIRGATNNAAPNFEAGGTITLDYNLASASTAGTYVGLFKTASTPNSHVVDKVTNSPWARADLPVGVSGAGVIQLQTPVVMDAGVQYSVMMFNENYDFFEPIAPTSYGADCVTGPHIVIAADFCKTDITVIATPTGQPSGEPSGEPTGQPSGVPTSPTGEPTGIPTSSPSYVEEPWGEYVWTEKRHRKAGMCENQCSGHGTCEVNGNCVCFKGLDGEAEWTGADCSLRTCPFDFAWVGSSINSNNLHPWAECSNKGICDRSSGECQCFTGYEGAACQRTVCPDNCNDQGTCWPEKLLASKAGRVYDAPWDAMKHVGCLCDAGYRGPACDQQECPSGADPLSGYGNEAGRDCSGRGICDYSSGICSCFTGFFGTRCQHQTTVM